MGEPVHTEFRDKGTGTSGFRFAQDDSVPASEFKLERPAAPPRPVRSRGSFWAKVLWSLAKWDDFFLAMGAGFLASLFHPEKGYFGHIEAIVRRGSVPKGVSVAALARDKKYVVLSDHHLLYQGSPHDYVSGYGMEPFCNEGILRQMLLYYHGQGYDLIENGDVEDLVVQEPRVDWSWMELLSVGIRGPIASRLFRGVEAKVRQRQLQRIQYSYWGLQGLINEKFHSERRLVKLYGNHEQDLKLEGLLPQLQRTYPGIELHDYAVMAGSDGQPPVVVCHGHQLDPWTNPSVADWIGESITESFSWAGQGADRIWTRGSWIRDFEHYENELVPAPSLAPREPGQFTPKVRHMGERYIIRQLHERFDGDPPWLVLGHSHEPRIREGARLHSERYLNCGAAGRYQDLVWASEIVEGRPKLFAWFVTDGILYRVEYRQRQNSLEPAGPAQEMGKLEEVPWWRPTREQIDAVVHRMPVFPLLLRAAYRFLPLLLLAAAIWWWLRQST